jgi:transcriptional regulator with XRE-family HTH domain
MSTENSKDNESSVSTEDEKKEDSMGLRLGQERKRMKYSQTAFGKLLGISKPTQVSYESNETRPDADYLLEVNQLGGDFYYIVTGQQHEVLKRPDERQLLADYRSLDIRHKPIVLSLVSELAKTNPPKTNVVRKNASRTKK